MEKPQMNESDEFVNCGKRFVIYLFFSVRPVLSLVVCLENKLLCSVVELDKFENELNAT